MCYCSFFSLKKRNEEEKYETKLMPRLIGKYIVKKELQTRRRVRAWACLSSLLSFFCIFWILYKNRPIFIYLSSFIAGELSLPLLNIIINIIIIIIIIIIRALCL